MLSSSLVVQAVLCVIFECYILRDYEATLCEVNKVLWPGVDCLAPDRTSIAIQLAVIVVEPLYQILLSLHATRHKNTVQAIGICVNNLAMFIMLILGMLLLHDWLRAQATFLTSQVAGSSTPDVRLLFSGYATALLAVFAIETVLLIATARQLSGEFAW